MANQKAFENGKATQFKSGKEAVNNGRKGGIASGKAKRMHKTFREMDIDETTDDEIRSMLNIVKKMGTRGNLNAIKLYMDMTGMDANGEDAGYEDDGLIDAIKTSQNALIDDLSMIKNEGDN